MVDHRPRYVQAAITGELGAEAYVPVLAIGEEVFVGEAYPSEELAPVEGGGGARREDEGRLVELAAVYLPVPETVGQPATTQRVPRPVEQTPVAEVHQLAREEPSLGVAIRRTHERPEPAGVLLRVVVQERDELGGRGPDARVHRRGEAAVLRQADHSHLREILLHERY